MSRTMEEFASHYSDPAEAARAWVGSLTPSELEEYVLAKAAGDMARLVRPAVTVPKAVQGRNVEPAQPTGPELRRRIVDCTVSMPDGTRVLWADMTAEMHDARADWLRDQAAGVLHWAHRHEQSAALIRGTGVSCLRELDGTGVSAMTAQALDELDVAQIAAVSGRP